LRLREDLLKGFNYVHLRKNRGHSSIILLSTTSLTTLDWNDYFLIKKKQTRAKTRANFEMIHSSPD
jgi:hypothetical protein